MKQTLGIFFLFLWSLVAFAQENGVSGKVSDSSDGSPIPGVSVIIKGTTSGIITDMDGKYQINARIGDVLVYSFIGMKSIEMPVKGSLQDVTLKSNVTDLDAVVVVGYGVQKKLLITGANQNIKGDAIASRSTSSAMEALQGIAPGVSISRDNGQPSASTRVVIRGLGTNGNSKPLYIVDGISTDNIDFLSTSDIEAIDILKDAASAAIYGARAANGVILVTTKRGKKGRKPIITYDAYYGVQNIYKNLSPLNAQEYMYIMDEGRMNDGKAPNNWEQMVKDNLWLDTNYPNGLGTKLGEDIWSGLQNGGKGTNWIDAMTQKNAPVQSHTINATGGTDDISYTFGASYLDQSGIIGGSLIDAGMKKMTLRMNTDFVLIKNSQRSILKVGETFSYTNNENRDVATGNIYYNDLHNALVQNPLMPAYWDKSPDKYGFTPNLQTLAPAQNNPLASMFYGRNYNWSKGNKILGNGYAELEPIKNLVFRTSLGINTWFGHSRSWSPTYDLGEKNGNNLDGAKQDMYFGNNFTWTNTVAYGTKIGDHKLDLLVGNEILKNQIDYNVGGTKSSTLYNNPDYAYLDNTEAPASISAVGTWGRDKSAGGGGLLSYMARAQYNYKEKYLLSGTMRADGSSNFAAGKRWGYFPSVSAGWVLSQESFMESTADLINFAKVRVSWGQNGNESIQNFVYSSTMSYLPDGYYFGDTKPVSSTSTVVTRVPNPDVTWETSEQLNLGLDSRFLDSKLSFTFDWYQKKTIDWLVEAKILGTFGAKAPIINGGDVRNTGMELSLGWNDNIGKFKYGVTVSGAHNENEVIKLNSSDGILHGNSNILSQSTGEVYRCEVGKPMGFFYGYQTAGILQNKAEVDAYVTPKGTPYFTDLQPGDVRFVDQNQDGVIDEKDKVMIGNPNPKFELGFQMNAEFKGVYVNATLAGKFGMQVMQSYRSFADKFDQNYTTDIFDRWHGEGTSNTNPRLSSASHRNTNFISDIYVHDADFLRITNLTMGYKFDQFLAKTNWMSSAKVFVTFKNLYTFTNYNGMDPEVSYGGDQAWASGIDLGLYPQPRTVLVGVSLAF